MEDSLEAKKENASKLTFILDTGDNRSFVRTAAKRNPMIIWNHQLRTHSGKFRTTSETTIQIKMVGKQVKAQELVHGGLPQSLLSTTPLIKQLGPVFIDRQNAVY